MFVWVTTIKIKVINLRGCGGHRIVGRVEMM